MENSPDEYIQQREIHFVALHPEPEQAQAARNFLRNVDGIEALTCAAPLCLRVVYDLRRITLQSIEQALDELGFHLDNSLLFRLKRALYYYTEDTQRANLGLENGRDSTTQVFVCRYQKRRHGCRDERPEHWRKYL